MKKALFLICITLVLLSTPIKSQYVLDKNYLGPSIGLSFQGSVPQIGLNHEYSMHLNEIGNVGVGGIMRYWNYNESFFGGEWSYSNLIIGAQGNYHFNINNPKVDLWAGLVLAVETGSVKYKGSGSGFSEPTHGGLWLALQGGARYWMSSDFALIARLGLGTLSYSALEIGVDWKL